ncbi:glycyl-radical enzyme activating protein [bacterium]|nr:glycyl-radical enzyme activating protein [bacterium]
MKTGLIFDLKRFAIHDGPGIRSTVFFKGCPLRCWWCHNPEGIGNGVPKSDSADIQADTCRLEKVGRIYSIDQLMVEIEKDVIFFDDSGGGVTFSGGEPLYQAEFLKLALQRCREIEIHTALDTSGFASAETIQGLSEFVDLFLFDLKLINNERHLLYTGVSNQQILKNLRWLAKKGKRLNIRFPVIPGITDTKENIKDLKQLLKELENVNHISLLPFHNIAAGKYERFGMENKFGGEKSLSEDQVLPLKAELESLDKTVTIGG